MTLCIVAVLCCGAIGVGLYGNDDLHNAVIQALDAAKSINNIVGSIRNQVRNYTSFLNTLWNHSYKRTAGGSIVTSPPLS